MRRGRALLGVAVAGMLLLGPSGPARGAEPTTTSFTVPAATGTSSAARSVAPGVWTVTVRLVAGTRTSVTVEGHLVARDLAIQGTLAAGAATSIQLAVPVQVVDGLLEVRAQQTDARTATPAIVVTAERTGDLAPGVTPRTTTAPAPVTTVARTTVAPTTTVVPTTVTTAPPTTAPPTTAPPTTAPPTTAPPTTAPPTTAPPTTAPPTTALPTTAPPVTGAIKPFPTRPVGGYLETWYPTTPAQVPVGYSVGFLAFAQVDATGAAVIPWMAADRARVAREIRNDPRPWLLSIGGQNGAQVGLTTAAQIDRFVATVVPLIDEFGVSGIDWDLERGDASAAGMAEATRRILAARPGLAVTVAPYGDNGIAYVGGTDAIYVDLARRLGSSLTCVNYQHYNLGWSVTATMVVRTLDRWTQQAGVGPQRWCAGFLAVDDWGGTTTPHTTLAAVWAEAARQRPGLRGTFTWGLAEKDLPNGWPFQAALAPVVAAAG